MHVSKKIMLPALALALGVGVITASAHVVQAATDSNTLSLPQRVAERFGLEQSEVEAVFDEFRDERHQEMKSHFEEKLSTLVTEGKLTEEQKSAILAKKEELWTEHQTLHSLSPEERKAFVDTEREELKAWAQAQGIDWEAIFGELHPEKVGRKMHRMWHFEEQRM